MILHTIGYTKKPLRTFIGLLCDANVDLVVDVRRRNTGQLAGWSKRDDLAFILENFGIRYIHRVEVAPPGELLDRYRRDHNWGHYVPEYAAYVRAAKAVDGLHVLLRQWERPCLLCSEHEPMYCHRRLLAEEIAVVDPSVSVVHLT